jgi:hypothetical protein
MTFRTYPQTNPSNSSCTPGLPQELGALKVRKKSIVPWKTTKRIPPAHDQNLLLRVAFGEYLNVPPGPSLSTLGKKPLYKAVKPSSFNMVPTAGQAQLYFGTDPAILGLFWTRLLTTSKGVFKMVPTVPPTAIARIRTKVSKELGE